MVAVVPDYLERPGLVLCQSRELYLEAAQELGSSEKNLEGLEKSLEKGPLQQDECHQWPSSSVQDPWVYHLHHQGRVALLGSYYPHQTSRH